MATVGRIDVLGLFWRFPVILLALAAVKLPVMAETRLGFESKPSRRPLPQ
jgi:hypothetical protein